MLPLPEGVRARMIPGVNGLAMHVLEAGHASPGRPLLLLLHGFPELAFSWRHVMVPLAALGFHVVAPDQRGYGRTTGWDGDYDADIAGFRMVNLARDAVALVAALGHARAEAVIGHDFGSPVAAWCALLRPDVFRAAVLMSAPFNGPAAPGVVTDGIHAALAALDPPRRHYQWWYSTREAEAEMLHCPQGLHAFLRAYFHMKSADWPDNQPAPLAAWTAPELARLPEYYVMRADRGMAATVAPVSAPAAAWLPDADLAVYAAEFARTGLQGGLNWYRCRTSGRFGAEEALFAGRPITVPTLFIGGRQDWGVYQVPGALARMAGEGCADFRGSVLIDGAGHWVQQERPAQVVEAIAGFLRA